jgi:uncharacterized protein (TIGR03435 family)
MTRLALLLALTVVAIRPPLAAQQQSPAPRFEVASIKLWRPPTTPVTGIAVAVAPAGSGIFNRATTVAGLITYAHEVQDFQLSGGPEWVRTERYDVSARAGREVSQTELREMVKALLADRFMLRVRTETREMPILELRLARSDGRVGPNLHDCSNPNDKDGLSTPEKPFRAPPNGGVATSDCANGVRNLAAMATRQLQTIVVDRTGLAGQWRFDVYYTGRPPQIPGVDLSQGTPNPNLPSFEGALREQLGLRLERTRGPAPVIVIESVERPTPN